MNEKISQKGRPFPQHFAPAGQTAVQIWEVGQKNLWKKRKNPSIQNTRKQLMRLALRQTHLYCYDKMSHRNTMDFRTLGLNNMTRETTVQTLLRFNCIIKYYGVAIKIPYNELLQVLRAMP